ncbi:hypothetical protein ACFXG6_27505 [Streptomyces roseus]
MFAHAAEFVTLKAQGRRVPGAAARFAARRIPFEGDPASGGGQPVIK